MAKFVGKFTDDGKINKAVLDEAPYINPVGWRHFRTQASQLKEKMNEYAEHGDFNNAMLEGGCIAFNSYNFMCQLIYSTSLLV